MRFRAITADPPWRFDDKLQMSMTPRSADDNYQTLSLDDICVLRVRDVAADDGCVLALWVPSVMLEDGLRVLKAWGFTFKGTYAWVKMRKDMQKPAIGMGHLFRQSHEIALIGVIGKPAGMVADRGQRSACLAVNEGHSKKPEHLQDSLDCMFPGELKLELFARRDRLGWVCTGIELDECDVRDALAALAAA